MDVDENTNHAVYAARAAREVEPAPDPSLAADVQELRRMVDALRKDTIRLREEVARLTEQTSIPYIDRALAARARGRS